MEYLSTTCCLEVRLSWYTICLYQVYNPILLTNLSRNIWSSSRCFSSQKILKKRLRPAYSLILIAPLTTIMKQNNTVDPGVISSIKKILNSRYLKESNILDLLPLAVSICDASGVIINYNSKAAQLWGRNPTKSDKNVRFCGAMRLYLPDGKYLPHNEAPVATCLNDGLSRENIELIIERPDLSRIISRVNVVPIKDEQGIILGAINCFNYRGD